MSDLDIITEQNERAARLQRIINPASLLIIDPDVCGERVRDTMEQQFWVLQVCAGRYKPCKCVSGRTWWRHYRSPTAARCVIQLLPSRGEEEQEAEKWDGEQGWMDSLLWD